MDEKAHSIVIPVKGLPREGKTFNFAIDGEFFQAFGNSTSTTISVSKR